MLATTATALTRTTARTRTRTQPHHLRSLGWFTRSTADHHHPQPPPEQQHRVDDQADEDHDLVIVGGGPAGLTLAAALASNTHLAATHSITLIEGGPLDPIRDWHQPPSTFSNRVSSITADNARLLADAGIWQHVDHARTRRLDELQVWDGLSDARIEFQSPFLPSSSSSSSSSSFSPDAPPASGDAWDAAYASALRPRRAHMSTMLENLNLQRAALRRIDECHHGNGTQEIVWRINADAQRVVAEHERAVAEIEKARASPRKSPRKGLGRAGREGGQEKEREGREEEKEEEARPRPLQIMYGSVHDIWSYPCEDGDPHLVAAASLALSSGQHGQHISNVHLEPFTSERQFHDELYPRYWDALGGRAEEFCERTRAGEGETLVIVSAGFDASEHESAGMSRHARNVPTSFYRRFARDAVLLAERCAGGKLVGVLEGGYSDWALASGVGAFLSGLVGDGSGREGDERDAWWSEAHLKKLDKACSVVKPRRGATSTTTSTSSSVAETHTLVGASPADATSDPWLARAVDIFTRIDEHATLAPPPPPPPPPRPSRPPAPPSSSSAPRQLRERKVRHNYAGLDDGSTPIASPDRSRRGGPPSSAIAAALAPPIPFVPSVPATTMAGAAAPKVEEGGPGGAAQGKPAVRFTWRQGGFGGEPRA
ncbi:hypothetical protein JCM8208_005500 [Rhodotorula glutinis]